MPSFELGATVHENIAALRVALGSVVKPLSLRDLAALINARNPSRRLNGATIGRWEAGVEPDYTSTRIMAELAGVSFEQFALGRQQTEESDITRDARKLTDEEIARAVRKVAETPTHRTSPSTMKRRPGGGTR